VAVYFWITVLFPVVHAVGEPVLAPSAGIESEGTPPFVPGHDHFTCAFCSASGRLAAAVASDPGPLLLDRPGPAQSRSIRESPPVGLPFRPSAPPRGPPSV
jgi:hypothetical protein